LTEPFVFGVDLDGVCGDYTAAFRAVAAEELDVAVESLPLERSWDFHEWGFGPGDYERIHRIAVLERRILRDLPIIDGAAEALWRLSDAGVWIRVITHRLYVNWSHATAVSDTVAWLDEARIPYRDICFLGAKPEVEADAYIDDGPHNVVALRALGNDVIVFDQPYNRDLDGPRAATWSEVEEIVEQLAAAKGKALQRQLPGFDAGADRIERRRGPVD
jgi:5'(3')-deoxyribonucleotidase